MKEKEEKIMKKRKQQRIEPDGLRKGEKRKNRRKGNKR